MIGKEEGGEAGGLRMEDTAFDDFLQTSMMGRLKADVVERAGGGSESGGECYVAPGG